MFVTKVRRLVNPHKRKAKARKGKRNPRKLTAKQVKFFGTSAQRAALKRRRKVKAKSNPRKRARAKNTRTRTVTKIIYRSRPNPRKRRKARKARRPAASNPAVVTLGFINPERKRKMAKRRAKRSNPRKGRKNPTRIVVMKARTRRHANRSHRRRSNPTLFGNHLQPAEMAKAVAAGLVGVTITKTIPPMLPASLTSSALMRVLISGAVAVASGYLAKSVVPDVSGAVTFGGLMQAGSVLLNAFLPSIGSTIGLQGMGDLIPGQFTVPQNPIRMAQMPAPSARVGVNGIRRSFGAAF